MEDVRCTALERLVATSHHDMLRVEWRVQNLEPGLAGTSHLPVEPLWNGQRNEHGGILNSLKHSWRLNNGKDH